MVTCVSELYQQIEKNLTLIQLKTLPGFHQLEYVRKQDMVCILNRLRMIELY